MAFEIRPIKPEEHDEFIRLVRIAFASEGEFTIEIPPEWTLCGFHDGKMATTYAAWPLKMRFNGGTVPIAGVTMVGTLPIYRRRNYLRQVTARHFELLHERGERPITALFASMAAIYQRYGYAVVSTKAAYTIEPRYLKWAMTPGLSGELCEEGEDSNDRLLDIYHHFIERRTGYLERSGDFMTIPGAPFATLSPPSKAITARITYREDGNPLGYIIYTAGRDIRPDRGMGQALTVLDLAWLSVPAYYAIWEYLSKMDLVNDIFWLGAPPDDPLPHLLLEPRKLNVRCGDGFLARIVDVERALPLRKYSREAELTFEVVDDLCPWNRGGWKLDTSPDGSAITRNDKTPQLVMPVSTLAMLAFGHVSATEAARMGRLDVADSGVLSAWDDAMRTEYQPYCANSF
jgi:predicted acetyltransferase